MALWWSSFFIHSRREVGGGGGAVVGHGLPYVSVVRAQSAAARAAAWDNALACSLVRSIFLLSFSTFPICLFLILLYLAYSFFSLILVQLQSSSHPPALLPLNVFGCYVVKPQLLFDAGHLPVWLNIVGGGGGLGSHAFLPSLPPPPPR